MHNLNVLGAECSKKILLQSQDICDCTYIICVTIGYVLDIFTQNSRLRSTSILHFLSRYKYQVLSLIHEADFPFFLNSQKLIQRTKCQLPNNFHSGELPEYGLAVLLFLLPWQASGMLVKYFYCFDLSFVRNLSSYIVFTIRVLHNPLSYLIYALRWFSSYFFAASGN